MEAIQKAISKKAEESVQEFDKELDVVVSKLSTEGWTLPAELNIYAVKTIANTNKLDDINAFLKWFFTTEDFQKTKDMVNGIKASPIKEGLKNLTDQCWQAFQNKLYAVCATSLLSVIEGILSEFSDDKQDVRMMKVCQKKVDTFPSTGSMSMYFLELFKGMISVEKARPGYWSSHMNNKCFETSALK